LPDVFGFLNIDKPLGITSHDVVHKVRRGLGIKKVGHAGTLDPLATGVLIVCLGGATRLSEYAMNSTKRYRARVHLGITTTTYDAEGEVTAERPIDHFSQNDVENALQPFLGNIEQIPPMYSAIKQGGRKLYDLARSGETVERAPRPVRIEALEIVDWSPPQFSLDVTCSAGTYIRSLAFDVGEVIGVGAHLAGLVRTASGAFTLENSINLETLLADPDWQRHLLPADYALASLPRLDLDAVDSNHILHGRVPQGDYPAADGLARAYDFQGRLAAILQSDNGIWRPHKVFLPNE